MQCSHSPLEILQYPRMWFLWSVYHLNIDNFLLPLTSRWKCLWSFHSICLIPFSWPHPSWVWEVETQTQKTFQDINFQGLLSKTTLVCRAHSSHLRLGFLRESKPLSTFVKDSIMIYLLLHTILPAMKSIHTISIHKKHTHKYIHTYLQTNIHRNNS